MGFATVSKHDSCHDTGLRNSDFPSRENCRFLLVGENSPSPFVNLNHIHSALQNHKLPTPKQPAFSFPPLPVASRPQNMISSLPLTKQDQPTRIKHTTSSSPLLPERSQVRKLTASDRNLPTGFYRENTHMYSPRI